MTSEHDESGGRALARLVDGESGERVDGATVGAAPAAAVAARAAIELLRTARPYRPPVGRKQRVWRRLEGHEPRRRVRPLRMALAVAVVIACGVTASARAHWLGALLTSAYEGLFSRSAASPRPAPTRAAIPAPGSFASSSASASPISDEGVARADVHADADGRSQVIGARPKTTTRLRRGSPAPDREKGEDDMGPLLAAMRAIHVEGDPARARSLLARYLAEHPRGRFTEEALAMAIEAAVALRDPAAAALADRYLTLYPSGPFRETARRAKQAPPAPAAP